MIADSSIVYLEGYLFDPPHAQEAFRRAAALAHAAGRKVALSLSDPFCVGRHRQAFLDLVKGHVDILFANEDEICALYETENFDVAARHTAQDTTFAALTRSGLGSVVLHDGQMSKVAPVPTQVVDTTGAGDAYAAGFMAGLTSGRTLPECGRLASVAASEIISHYGARHFPTSGKKWASKPNDFVASAFYLSRSYIRILRNSHNAARLYAKSYFPFAQSLCCFTKHLAPPSS